MSEAIGARLDLADACKGENASALKSQILEMRGQDLTIDLTNVKAIDTPNLEVLIGAARLWSSDGRKLSLGGDSLEFASALNGLQIDQTEFESRGNADA